MEARGLIKQNNSHLAVIYLYLYNKIIIIIIIIHLRKRKIMFKIIIMMMIPFITLNLLQKYPTFYFKTKI
jgi:hypothetical protein